ncbi:hypothetical protein [Nocardioides halotolerans]|uniref:hypothetical protein n=1 Tax=Nocardioides halotolerans TaxID=433660 RepID=UPI0012FBBC76|nr:hypothetical protein [Nocardioides halotolerans]
MSSLHRDVVRATDQARLAAAAERHLADRVRREAKAERRARHRASRPATPVWLRWAQRLATWRAQARTPLAAVADRRPEDVAAELSGLLERIAGRIAARGTEAEQTACEALASATRWTAPGAAAALVDWDGAEVARLRAFGVLHGVAMGQLAPHDQAWLRDRLHPGGASRGDLVA